MEALVYFVVWGALIFLMMRFGCGAHVMGHGHRHGASPEHDRAPPGADARSTAPELATDPVCGMSVKTATAKASVHDGRVFYFCSGPCRDKFESEPGAYVKAAFRASQPMEDSHGSHH